MFPDLSKSSELLCDLVQEILHSESFIDNLDETASVIKGDLLYWNIGVKQGFVVVDHQKRKVYRVFEVDEVLSDHQICDGALAQLVLNDLFSFIDSIQEDLLKEGLLTLYLNSRDRHTHHLLN
jgi:hypothetical protein